MASEWDLAYVRNQFPALDRQLNGRPVAFFDGPAGSQVPQRVIDAVAGYILNVLRPDVLGAGG